jgi:hypothetical protein
LSSWFKDYLYIPLGGSKKGKIKSITNTFIIFLVSGFWHGASWNFILWGGIHACLFMPLLLKNQNRKHVSDIVAQDRRFPNMNELLQMFQTFTLVTIAWIFFRSPDLNSSIEYIKLILKSLYLQPEQVLSKPFGLNSFFYIIPLVTIDWWLRLDERKLKVSRFKIINYIFYYFLFYIIFHFFNRESTFIYFQF